MVVAACTVGADSSGSGSIVPDVVLAASLFPYVLGRIHPRSLVVNRLRVELWILDGKFKMQMTEVGARPAFDGVHSVAVRICIFVDPRIGVLESDRIYYKRVTVPTTDGLTKIGGVRILRVRTPVRSNEAECII